MSSHSRTWSNCDDDTCIKEKQMKLLFKQRFFSWFDSYDIYDESGTIVYTVKGQLSWGHCLKIFDVNDNEVGIVKQQVFTFLPKFDIYINNQYVGCIKRELSFFKPQYTIDYCGWYVQVDILEWDYQVFNQSGNIIATVSKQIVNLTDTYELEMDIENALGVLMLVLAIDAEKCSRK